MCPATLQRHSSVKAPLVVTSNSALVSTFSLVAVLLRSSQTSVVTWTHQEGRPTLHTTHRAACRLTIQGPLMFSVSQSVHPSRLWGVQEEHISSVVLRLRCLVGVTWHLNQCLPPRGALRGSNRQVSGWAPQQMAEIGVAIVELILAHRGSRLDQHCLGNRKAVTRVSCKASFPPTFLNRATTSEQCSAVPQSAWSTAVCLEALQETYRPRPPVPVFPKPRRLRLCDLPRETRATFLRSVVICTQAQVCEQDSPTLHPHTAALSQAAPLPPLVNPLLLASTLAILPEILSPPN